METKLRITKILNLRLKLGLKNRVAIDSNGKSKGLALFWNDNMDFTFKSYSVGHIDVIVKQACDGGKWLFIGFCGLIIEKRKDSWFLLI